MSLDGTFNIFRNSHNEISIEVKVDGQRQPVVKFVTTPENLAMALTGMAEVHGTIEKYNHPIDK